VPRPVSGPSLIAKAEIGDAHHDAAQPAPTTRDASDEAANPAPVTQDFGYLTYYVWSELPPAERPADIVLSSGRGERTPLRPIDGLDLTAIGKDKTLVGMLRHGELDALFTARAPSSFVQTEPHIAQLFCNSREAERAYFRKTKLFPIMHLVGIRKDIVDRFPYRPACTKPSAKRRH
jgi:hypothetical protein